MLGNQIYDSHAAYHRRFNHFTIKLTDFAIKLTDYQCFGVNMNFNCII